MRDKHLFVLQIASYEKKAHDNWVRFLAAAFVISCSMYYKGIFIIIKTHWHAVLSDSVIVSCMTM